MEATDVVPLWLCLSLLSAGSLAAQTGMFFFLAGWIDYFGSTCPLRLLMTIFPPISMSSGHTIGILFGTGAFWIILFFFIFALGSSFFCGLLCLLFSSSELFLILLLQLELPHFPYTATSTTNHQRTILTTQPLALALASDLLPSCFNPRVFLYNTTLLIACCCLAFLLSATTGYSNHILSRRVDSSGLLRLFSQSSTSTRLRPVRLPFPSDFCILRMLRYYYTL